MKRSLQDLVKVIGVCLFMALFFKTFLFAQKDLFLIIFFQITFISKTTTSSTTTNVDLAKTPSYNKEKNCSNIETSPEQTIFDTLSSTCLIEYNKKL